MTRPRTEQLPFSLAHRPSLAGEDFLIAGPNRDAVAWLDRWPHWPSTALVIHGPPGCGKTHLAHVFLARSGGIEVTVAALAARLPEELLAGTSAVVLDDADQAAADGLEEALLHLYNAASDGGRRMLLTAGAPPARWRLALPDLRSRLSGSPAVGIGPPDDDLLAAVMVKQFADRQIAVDDGVITYLVARIERSFDAVRRLVARLDAAALAQHRPITLPLARAVLQGEAGSEPEPG